MPSAASASKTWLSLLFCGVASRRAWRSPRQSRASLTGVSTDHAPAPCEVSLVDIVHSYHTIYIICNTRIFFPCIPFKHSYFASETSVSEEEIDVARGPTFHPIHPQILRSSGAGAAVSRVAGPPCDRPPLARTPTHASALGPPGRSRAGRRWPHPRPTAERMRQIVLAALSLRSLTSCNPHPFRSLDMRYHLAPLFCRPWTLNGMSSRLPPSDH